MSERVVSKAPVWFIFVAIILLGWNLMGLMAYIMQVTMSPETIAAMPKAHQQLYENTPTWVTAAFAIAVHAGALGCLLLLLRKSLALLMLQVSLAAVLAQMFHMFFISNTFEVLGSEAMVMPVSIVVIAIYLVMLAAKAKTRRWTD